MEHWQITLVVLLVIFGGIAFELHRRRFTRVVQSKLNSRPHLTAEQFGRMYFGASTLRANMAADLRNIIAKHLPVSINGLHPDDKFQETLMMDMFDSMTTVEIIMEIEERFGIKRGDDEEIRPDISFRQLVDYVERRARMK